MDMTMPGIGGREIYDKMKKINTDDLEQLFFYMLCVSNFASF